MADVEDKKCSKSAKRRAKRRTEKDADETTSISCADPLQLLRQQMEKAKSEKNHAAVNALRQQIWLLQDANAGVRSDVSAEQLGTILQEKGTNIPTPKTATTVPNKHSSQGPSFDECRKEVLEKKLWKLQKKKDDVQKIKDRLSRGQKLEKTQEQKIEREKLIDEEINECDDELSVLNQNLKQQKLEQSNNST
uniref:Uncharacterized protein LOC100175053 n=1 Tax=Phallusia mammillata TaxID=59560 RepID=A0A6F9DG75_9ASCI|nr:uncharacterized protein LOC100175053 [Phallusia mammillata]